VTAAMDESFLGVGWGFPPKFGPDGHGVVMVASEEDIAQSLNILVRTIPGERVMQPEYGCDLQHMVFEVMDSNRVTDIKTTLTRAVRLFEPRVIIEQVIVDTIDWIDGVVRIDMHYTIIATNTRHNLVFPLYRYEASTAGFTA
jgi:phage baseplate assembly protein W